MNKIRITYYGMDGEGELDKYPSHKREAQSWARWQRDYIRLKSLGNDDQYCHTNAQG